MVKFIDSTQKLQKYLTQNLPSIPSDRNVENSVYKIDLPSSLTCGEDCDQSCLVCVGSGECVSCRQGFKVSRLDNTKCISFPNTYLKILEKNKYEGLFSDKKSIKIEIKFDHSLEINNLIIDKKLAFTIAQNYEPFTDFSDVTFKLTQQSQTLVIEFKISKALTKATLTISAELIKSIQVKVPKNFKELETRMENLKLEDKNITVEDINLFFSADLAVISAAVKPIQSTTKVITLGVIATNAPGSSNMITVMQYFSFLSLVNIPSLPQNYDSFMDIFRENVFDIMPNLLEVDESNHQMEDQKVVNVTSSGDVKNGSLRILSKKSNPNQYCDLNSKFSTLGLNCLMLNNTGNILLELLMFAFFKAMLKLILMLIPEKKSENQVDNSKQTPENKGLIDQKEKTNKFASDKQEIEVNQVKID